MKRRDFLKSSVALVVVPAALVPRGEKYGAYINHWGLIEGARGRELLLASAEQCLRGFRHGEITLEFNKPHGSGYVSGWTTMVYGGSNPGVRMT
jgi:hypothetical protein